MIGEVVLGGLALAAPFALARLVIGRSPLDRALAAQALGFLGAAGAGALALRTGRAEFVDVALLSLATQLVLTVAVLKAVRRRSLQAPLATLAAPAAPASEPSPS